MFECEPPLVAGLVATFTFFFFSPFGGTGLELRVSPLLCRLSVYHLSHATALPSALFIIS
jgi:hypothetical protein